MLIRSVFLASFLFIIGSANAFYIPEVDSSEESSIEFVQLKAISSSRIVHFTWEVAEEVAGDYFIIEKSIDKGESWSKVSKIQSMVDHNESHTYEVSEINMVEGVKELFRISRVDKYGEIQLLDEVDINHPVLSNMKLIPDPKRIKRSVTVSCESMIESGGTIYVYDEEGALVYTNDMKLIDGYNRTVLLLKNLEPGNYSIVVRNEFSDKLARRLVVY